MGVNSLPDIPVALRPGRATRGRRLGKPQSCSVDAEEMLIISILIVTGQSRHLENGDNKDLQNVGDVHRI